MTQEDTIVGDESEDFIVKPPSVVPERQSGNNCLSLTVDEKTVELLSVKKVKIGRRDSTSVISVKIVSRPTEIGRRKVLRRWSIKRRYLCP